MATIDVDEYILDTLMRDLVGHDRQPAAFLVYLYLWRASRKHIESKVQTALLDIADNTGLSKRSVQSALGRLAKRQLISISRASITAIPVYTVLQPWSK